MQINYITLHYITLLYTLDHKASTRYYVQHTSNTEAQFSDEFFQNWNAE